MYKSFDFFFLSLLGSTNLIRRNSEEKKIRNCHKETRENFIFNSLRNRKKNHSFSKDNTENVGHNIQGLHLSNIRFRNSTDMVTEFLGVNISIPHVSNFHFVIAHVTSRH